MKNKLLLMLGGLLVAMGMQAQLNTPVGVYEAKDKNLGMTRLAYLEINVEEPKVPDFSQLFKKDENYKFMLLPENFQKKPSNYFKGQNAVGFVKYQSRMLLVNSEICKLSNPREGKDCWSLDWEDDLGKKGTCTLYVPTDSTLYFIGLGSFAQSIGPDSLHFVLSKQAMASKSYLVKKPRPQKVEQPSGAVPVAGKVSVPNIPANLRDWKPEVPKSLKMPPANSGIIKGLWSGKNTDGSTITVKLNSTVAAINYYGTKYFGLINMNGPSFIKEGVVRIVKLEENRFALYSRPLDTGVQDIHYSVVTLYNKDLLFYPTAATPALSVMGRPVPVSQMIYCKMTGECFTGMFTTGKEVSNFPLNLLQKTYFKDNTGEQVECHGFVFTSFNMGNRTDADEIISTEPIDDKKIKIKYQCGRTGNVYTAILVYNPATKIFKATQVMMVKGESEAPDSDDCYLPNAQIKYVGTLKE